MSIKTKNWAAQINRMPGDAFFRTTGIVAVANPGITPTLVFCPIQDKSFDLRLELKLETSSEVALQVVTEKLVEYKVPGDSNVSGVSIFYKGKLVHHIDKVDVTN
ncbi:hypothetical protein [Pseudomonas sp. Ant30-3]|uniref:hypothetical protein n=1 Tax=Pseudomonas sp. Ant30-3 TaxID=1488328 RepID=UPI00048EAC3E|nr:hypothetical protein [Pseudomonas sp. Ant30-3]